MSEAEKDNLASLIYAFYVIDAVSPYGGDGPHLSNGKVMVKERAIVVIES